MMWDTGDGWGWWMLFGWVWMVFFWGLIIWAVVTIANRLGGDRDGVKTGRSALDILEERYARGEINDTQFDEMRRRINANRG